MNKTKKYFVTVALAALTAVLCALCLIACGKDSGNIALATPKNLRVVDEVLMWDEVQGAHGYDIEIDGKQYESENAELNIFLITSVPKKYTMRVRAAGDLESKRDSAWSQTMEYSVNMPSGWGVRLINDDTEYEIGVVNKFDVIGKFVIPERLPDGKPITQIAAKAFKNCKLLTSVIIPDTITKIENYAFSGCVNLTTVRMPSNLMVLNDGVFKGCEGLKEIKWSDDLEEIGKSAFEDCKSLTEIKMPHGVRIIKGNAFKGCSSLVEVRLPDMLDDFEYTVFMGCDLLSSITINEKSDVYKCDGNCIIRRSDNAVIAGCGASVIPDYVTSIEENAFNNSVLNKITIPSSVTYIGSFAFNDSGLKKITIPSSVNEIGADAFSSNALEEIELPETFVDKPTRIFPYCKSLKKITVDENNPVYKSDGNCIIRKSDNQLVMGCVGSVVPDYVESIGNNAFGSLPITHITVKTNDEHKKEEGVLELPDGIKSIGASAFAACSLLTVQLPDSVAEIGTHAFDDCYNLRSFMITSNSKLNLRDEDPFFWATVYTSFDELPDSWYFNGNREKGSAALNSRIVTGCVFVEDNGRLYVDSFTIGGNSRTLGIWSIISPYRKGYSFVGWARDSRDGEMMELRQGQKGNPSLGVEGSKYTYMEHSVYSKLPTNTVLYAVWEPIR
ncbi:MAG: leucine-rich repeat domain-containing protein [Clostridiales bacterium]|nr:leucine-rich repeat domain-containing protein [Clostridiales bacterium]